MGFFKILDCLKIFLKIIKIVCLVNCGPYSVGIVFHFKKKFGFEFGFFFLNFKYLNKKLFFLIFL